MTFFVIFFKQCYSSQIIFVSIFWQVSAGPSVNELRVQRDALKEQAEALLTSGAVHLVSLKHSYLIHNDRSRISERMYTCFC